MNSSLTRLKLLLMVIIISCFPPSFSLAEGRLEQLYLDYAQDVSDWPVAHIDEGIEFSELSPLPENNRDLAADPHDPLWDDVTNKEVVALGARLFADPRLSRKRGTSCLSCHQASFSFSDGRQLGIGEDGLMGRRRSMSLFGTVGSDCFFWDCRAATLHEQVLMPISDERELNFHVEGVLERFDEVDQLAFDAAFSEGPSKTTIARALAAYVASLRPPKTRFDLFLETRDSSYLNADEILGLHVFRTKGRCLNCHSGPLMTDQKLHNIGLSFAGRRNQDLGRYEVTRNLEDVAKFKTPSLRGVSKNGAWMHNGMFVNLHGVVRLYAAGMPTVNKDEDLPFEVGKSPHIQRLDLSEEEIEALVAFLELL